MAQKVLSKKESSSIIECFPLIKEIKDSGLKHKVIQAWTRIWRESGYTSLKDAPMAVTGKERGSKQTLVQHLNATARVALASAIQIQEEYGIKINLDYLIAGAILHDLDKPLIYQRKQDRVEDSKLGEMIPHGTYGVHVALEEGLPLEIAHVIITHSTWCAVNPRTIEGVIILQAEGLIGSAMRAATSAGPVWKYLPDKFSK